jgi:hypothetical protein
VYVINGATAGAVDTRIFANRASSSSPDTVGLVEGWD